MAEFMSAWGWVIAIVIQLIVGWLIWSLKSGFATKEELKDVSDRLDEHDRHLDVIDTKLESSPDHDDLERIHMRIGDVKDTVTDIREKLGGVVSDVTSLKNSVMLLTRHELGEGVR